MTCQITILTSAKRCLAAKTFRRGLDDLLVKEPVQMPRLFRAEQRSIETIEDLAAILIELGDQSNKFVIRGETCPDINALDRIRRLQYSDGEDRPTFRSARRRWVCFDFDTITCPTNIDPAKTPIAALDSLCFLLPKEFHDASYFAHWSSSAGIDGWKTISAHLWFMFDRGVTDEELLMWSETLHLPIDRRLFNPIQPHFTASPIFVDRITDPCPQRNHFHKGGRDNVSIDLTMIRKVRNDPGRIEDDTDEAEPYAKRIRSKTRTRRTKSRPSDPQMGSRRCEDQRPRSSRTPIHALSIEIDSQTGELIFSD